MNKQKASIFMAISLFFMIGIGIYLMSWKSDRQSFGSESLEVYAEEMVDTCADAPHRPTCYEKEVPQLVEHLPTDKIFDVIRLIRKNDPEYLYCHVLAHALGSYEVSLDPDRWLDVIAKGPTDGLCSNGFAHGAIVTRFSDGKLTQDEYDFAVKELSIACEKREEWDPTELMKAMCYHGIGHVLVHMTQADVEKSIQACEVIGLANSQDFRQLCVEGVYMQVFQPLEPEDFALVDLLPLAPTRDNVTEFCTNNSYNDMQYGACWREAWPVFGNEIFTSKGVTDYCSQITQTQDQHLCYTTVFTINGRQNLSDPQKMATMCNDLPSELQGSCFARGANAFPEEDPGLIPQAIALCNSAQEQAAQAECYGFLAEVASFNFHPSSPAHEELCSSLPDEWESTCRRS